MATIKELELAAETARDNDSDATVTLISLARTFVMKHREGRVTSELMAGLIIAVDAQRETAQARVLASKAWIEACALQAVSS